MPVCIQIRTRWSRSKATIHNRCVYINRNRRRKIIGRGNSLSASIRSSTPRLAHYTISIISLLFVNLVGGRFESMDRIKKGVHLDWREYLRAGFASGHGPASGSRRVLASQRYEEGERERERSVEREKDERRWKGDGEIRGRRRGKGTARSHTQRCVQSVTRVLRGDPICKVLPTRRRRIVSLDSVFPPTPPFYTCIYIYI